MWYVSCFWGNRISHWMCGISNSNVKFNFLKQRKKNNLTILNYNLLLFKHGKLKVKITEKKSTFFFLLFRENKVWHFMWIICLTNNSHEIPFLYFIVDTSHESSAWQTSHMKCRPLISLKKLWKKICENVICYNFVQCTLRVSFSITSNRVSRENRHLPTVYFQFFYCCLTLKIKSKSPISDQFFIMSQLYIHENLLRIQPLVQRTLCRQESVMPTSMLTLMPMGSAPNLICEGT